MNRCHSLTIGGTIMKYNGVVFDFNGTLFFDDAFHDEAWDRITMELFHQHMPTERIATELAGLPNVEILRRLSGDTLPGDALERYSLRKEELYREIVRNVPGGPRLSPGAEELFDYLKANGIPCAIASASIIQNIEFFVEIFHLDKWFDMDHIIYDNSTYKNKLMMFRDAIDRLGIKEGTGENKRDTPDADESTDENKMTAQDAFVQSETNRNILIFEDSLSGITCASEIGASIVAIRKKALEQYYGRFPQIVAVMDDLCGAKGLF